jgi:hypothetical protein
MCHTFLILFCLFTGCGEHSDAYGWLRIGEDMYGLPQNLISHEIVRTILFSVLQRLLSLLPPHYSQDKGPQLHVCLTNK